MRWMRWTSVGILATVMWACGPALPGEEEAATPPAQRPALYDSQAGLSAPAGATPTATPPLPAPATTPTSPLAISPVGATELEGQSLSAVDPQTVPQDPIPCLNGYTTDGTPIPLLNPAR